MRLFSVACILLSALCLAACSQESETAAAEKNFKLCEASANIKLNEIRDSVKNKFGLEVVEDEKFQAKLNPEIRVLFFRKPGSQPWMILMRTDKMNGMYQVYREKKQTAEDLRGLIAMMEGFSVNANKCLETHPE